MKRSLLALAILSAFAGVASAQTNVTVYGIVDAGITRETGGAAGTDVKLATGVQSGNRLGFKGSEDLGSGLKANFQIEAGFNLDTGTSRQGQAVIAPNGTLFGRQAYVGLSGDFGAVNLGRQYTPFFVALDSIDPFGTGLTGASTNLMNGSAVRVNNAITYSTPGMGGFSVNALYGFGEVPGDTSSSRTYDVGVGYANGPLTVVAVYDNSTNATDTNTTKLALAGGAFNFGPATAHLAYETEKNDIGMDYRDWLVGASVPMGAGKFIASYIRKDDRSAAGNTGAKQYAIGYTYALSKRTNLYTSYSHVRNDAGGAWVAGDASSGGATFQVVGDRSTGFTVGVRHKF